MTRPFLAFSSLCLLSTLVAGTALVACGSSSGGSGTTSTGGAGGSGSTSSSSSTHDNGCILTTDTGNNNGVGAYCTPGGGQCTKYPQAGLCLADVGQSPWFCTRIGCTMTSDCGDNATCLMQSGGSACVPNKCLGDGGTGPGDAGGG